MRVIVIRHGIIKVFLPFPGLLFFDWSLKVNSKIKFW